jgi:hypothetical protein
LIENFSSMLLLVCAKCMVIEKDENQSDTKRSRYNDNNKCGWKNEGFRAYANYMATTAFGEGIHEILLLMTNYNNVCRSSTMALS